MKRRNHKGEGWKPHAPSYSNDAPVNNPFAGLKFVRIVQKDATDSTPHSPKQTAKKFKPPLGPKHLPLSQCPNLAALLHKHDRSEMDKIAKSLLARPHDYGFKITLEPGSRLEVREIYGEKQETFTSWHIAVRRDWKGVSGECKSSNSEYSLRVEDNRVLASALYLADLLDAKKDKIHLFKPFRPSAYVEAWLEQKNSMNPALVAKMKEVDGKVYVYQKDGSLSAPGMKPVSLFVGLTEYSLKNWRDLIVKTCDILDRKNRKLLQELASRIGDAFLSEKSEGMRTPKLHEPSGLYMEMNLPAYSHVLHSQLLFRKFQYNLDEIGIVYTEKGVSDEGGESRFCRRTTKKDARELGGDELKVLHEITQDLIVNYPGGFDFKETSIRLVESRVEMGISETIIEALRSLMFERSDGMWLFDTMVINPADLILMTSRAKEILADEGAFALDSLFTEFEGSLRNILCGRDFKLFFDKFLAEKVSGKVRGHEGWRVCFKAEISEDDGWATIGGRVRQLLLESGDAVTMDDILLQVPHLDREVVLRVCQEYIKDAIVFTTDEIEYVKLLETYYLPDDFANVLKAFVERTESSQNVVSVVLLESELNSKYGEGFRVNFGLEDDVVFKQVVSKAYMDNHHLWNGDAFLPAGGKAYRNVADEFVNIRKGVFHEDEFFQYALEKRGLNNHATLVCQYLRTRCIRLNRTMWIGVEDFVSRNIIDKEGVDAVRAFLREQLGTSPILHIGLIPEMAFATLASMTIDGCEYQWNAYSVTSVARHLIEDLNLVNDEPSPYYVTSIILPDDVDLGKNDIIEFVFAICRDAGKIPQTEDEAFLFLKNNLVRMTKTTRLLEKIRKFWRF